MKTLRADCLANSLAGHYVTMAGSTVVLNDVLCFIVHKFSSSPVKILKSALADFHSGEAISVLLH